jgi:hypothetical protein
MSKKSDKEQVIKDEAAAEDRDAARKASELHASTIQASQDAARIAADEKDAAAAEKTFWTKLREAIGL